MFVHTLLGPVMTDDPSALGGKPSPVYTCTHKLYGRVRQLGHRLTLRDRSDSGGTVPPEPTHPRRLLATQVRPR